MLFHCSISIPLHRFVSAGFHGLLNTRILSQNSVIPSQPGEAEGVEVQKIFFEGRGAECFLPLLVRLHQTGRAAVQLQRAQRKKEGVRACVRWPGACRSALRGARVPEACLGPPPRGGVRLPWGCGHSGASVRVGFCPRLQAAGGVAGGWRGHARAPMAAKGSGCLYRTRRFGMGVHVRNPLPILGGFQRARPAWRAGACERR
jgi:hypothetical protein